jgi:hypothetical protein
VAGKAEPAAEDASRAVHDTARCDLSTRYTLMSPDADAKLYVGLNASGYHASLKAKSWHRYSEWLPVGLCSCYRSASPRQAEEELAMHSAKQSQNNGPETSLSYCYHYDNTLFMRLGCCAGTPRSRHALRRSRPRSLRRKAWTQPPAQQRTTSALLRSVLARHCKV